MTEVRIDISRRHVGMKPEDQQAELLGIGHESALVVGLTDHADPQPVLTMRQRPDLPVLAVLGLQRPDAGH